MLVDLVGVVAVNDQAGVQAVPAHPLQASLVEAAGNDRRQGGGDRQGAHMSNGFNPLGQPRQMAVGGAQRVPATVDHLRNAAVSAYIVERLLPGGATGVVVFVGEVTPEAVAAVNCAAARHHQ